ncbi:MAG: secretin N-terminal domain-containing protein [Candidatus Omnitrophica bacterium]|nr:secretin N-terminal domain-containing protein [Candidatus Omnitrophota bacterium]
MKSIRNIILLVILVMSSVNRGLVAEEAPSQLAQTPSRQAQAAILPISGGITGRISLDLRNIDVTEALKFIATKAEINIIATKNVTGRITLMVENVPVKDVFDITLRSNGLAYTKQGEIYNVMTEEEYKALYGKKFADIRQVKTFKLRYAIPEQAFSLLDTLKSEVGRVLVEPESGTALIMDTPENIKQIENALAVFEQKNLVRVFTLKYSKVKDVEEQLKAQLDAKKVGSIKVDERSNQVVIQALPERMPDIEMLVKALDRKTKQVLIDTKIVKVKLSDQLTTGIDWEGLFSLGTKVGATYMGSYPFSVIPASTTAVPWQSRDAFLNTQQTIGAYPTSTSTSQKITPGQMHVGMINKKQDFDVLIKYLQTLGNTQILSNPKLAVINNQEARIHVGEKQAYVTTTTTTGQTTSTVSEEVTFVDVGIQLSVTPTINDDGYVTMKVKPEVSSVVSTLTTPSGNKIPIIDSSMAETTVMVKDGSTIVIGGLRKEEKTSNNDQVPILGKIPLLGFFFRSGTKKTERTELLVMLTPHIVSGDTLTTGDEREFEIKPGKDYKEYPAFTEKPDFKPPEKIPEKIINPKPAEPEEEIKAYREYPVLKEEKEYKPTIKGEGDNE